MTLNSLGIEVPADTDEFVPAADMRELAASMAGRVVVPVANTAERNALAATLTPSPSRPLYVHRADAPVWARTEWTENGTEWNYVPTPRTGVGTASTQWWVTDREIHWVQLGPIVTLFGSIATTSGQVPPTGSTLTLGGIPNPSRPHDGRFRFTGSGGELLFWISAASVVTFTGAIGPTRPSFSLDGFVYEASA